MSENKYFNPLTDPRLYECSETGKTGIKSGFVLKLDDLREACGFPFIITSGFRSAKHSKEINKPGGGGRHTEGIACDIRCKDGVQRYRIVSEAISLGFGGIGVAKTFVHVDTREGQPVLWTY